jgi:hypothetical protein
MKHPIQPVERGPGGTPRFRGNAVVFHLLEHGGFSLYQLMNLDVPAEDREQFAQLIGLTLAAAEDWVSEETRAAAEQMFRAGITESEARNNYLREQLAALREWFRVPVSKLYAISPEDLKSR